MLEPTNRKNRWSILSIVACNCSWLQSEPAGYSLWVADHKEHGQPRSLRLPRRLPINRMRDPRPKAIKSAQRGVQLAKIRYPSEEDRSLVPIGKEQREDDRERGRQIGEVELWGCLLIILLLIYVKHNKSITSSRLVHCYHLVRLLTSIIASY